MLYYLARASASGRGQGALAKRDAWRRVYWAEGKAPEKTSSPPVCKRRHFHNRGTLVSGPDLAAALGDGDRSRGRT
jgi:hypothetical protein